jgi:4-hydroxybenzoyl-CoA reductase subunit beta
MEPKTLKEATKALMTTPERAVILAGGTDLIVQMKHRVIQPERVINLKGIPKLAYISERKSGLSIGPLTSLDDIASSKRIQEKYPALSQAAKEVGAYAHQVMGTIGGNLCQGNRCRYYNQSFFWRKGRTLCYKAGGKICHLVPHRPAGRRKPVECYSTYCGDLAPVLIALDAQIKVSGTDGERCFPLFKFYTHHGKKPLAIRKGEILKEVFVPSPSGKTLYLKWRLRNALEFPIVSLALHIEKKENGRIQKAKIIFSAVGPGPVEALEAETILEKGSLDDERVEKASNQAVKEISPMRTSVFSPAYKRKMAGVLLRKGLEQLRNAE